MERFMMNVDGNCCERLAVTLFYGAKALSANASVPKSVKGGLVTAKKKQKPRERPVRWHGCCWWGPPRMEM